MICSRPSVASQTTKFAVMSLTLDDPHPIQTIY